jgi:hypothetical protein
MREPYQDGCRLAIPEGVKNSHFLYHVDVPALSPLDCFAKIAKDFVGRNRLSSSKIDAVSIRKNNAIIDELAQPFERIVDALGLTAEEAERETLLVCEWASVHADPTFAGKAFISVVVHTGPQPYVMQLASTGVRMARGGGRILTLPKSVCQLNVGDVILFDPTTPHMAAPKRPMDGQLLVLLQFELDDPDDESRAQLLSRFRPKEGVLTGELVFSDHSSDPLDYVPKYK